LISPCPRHTMVAAQFPSDRLASALIVRKASLALAFHHTQSCILGATHSVRNPPLGSDMTPFDRSRWLRIVQTGPFLEVRRAPGGTLHCPIIPFRVGGARLSSGRRAVGAPDPGSEPTAFCRIPRCRRQRRAILGAGETSAQLDSSPLHGRDQRRSQLLARTASQCDL
jgi:hypothetical protein